MAVTNKVKFKTNKPIMLPVQTKTWGLHEAVDMHYDEVFKLLAGGAEDIMLVADDGSETPVTWDNLEDLFPREAEDPAASTPTTLESDIFVGYDETYDPYIHGFDEGVQSGDFGISQPIEIVPETDIPPESAEILPGDDPQFPDQNPDTSEGEAPSDDFADPIPVEPPVEPEDTGVEDESTGEPVTIPEHDFDYNSDDDQNYGDQE